MAEADSKPISILVFVMMDGDPYRLISANSNDTIKSVHYQIREVFGIPLTLQKIYYFGKRLEWCQTLKECSIKNYACLQVVLRKDGVTRQNSSEALNLVSQIHAMCQRKSVAFDYGCISNKIRDLFSILRQQTTFLLVTLPSSFVTLYENIEEIGDAVIRFFLDSLLKMMLAKGWLDKCASILTRLCVSLLSYHGDGNHLYLLCRTHLTELFEKGNYKINFEYLEDPITSILFIFRELAESLPRDLDRRATPSSGVIDVRHFKAFSLVLCNTIHLRVDSALQYYLRFEPTFSDLLSKTEAYLAHFENFSYMESAYCGYSQYLTILKALHVISKLCKSGEERFWNVLRNKRRSLLELIAKCTDRTNDHLWLLERKDVMDSKYRMHLAMMMMTEIRIHDVELYEMLVWSEKLDANLYMAFKNQQITNREVQQYWLRQLCGAIFNPQKSLFLACPNDPKRFYPNPAIEPKTLDLECFKFVGKLVAIALMSKIQIGVAFAHVFLMQLAGRRKISLEAVRDLDPSLHSWCKEIIDGEVIDSEVLEFPEALLGCQWSTELSYVNSKSSREAYVDHLIQHRFVASISEQVSFFMQGFDSVFGTSIGKLLSVKGLELEDLNESLCGYVITTTLQLDNKSNPLMSRFPKVRRQGRNITNWRRGVRLGSGSFGSVYEGFATDGFFFAVKELLLPDGGIIDLLEKEVDLLCQLTHPNIVKYFGTSKDESKLYVFLELVSKGSLEKVYKEFPLQDSHVSVYTKQILKGLNYLHERNVVHRDIKCANVLVDENGCVKIADFGLAKVTNLNAIIKSCKGTACWMAPEVFNSKIAGGYGFQADIWSVGCTVLEMLTGKPPYSDLGLEKGQLIYRIGKGHRPSLPDSLSDDSRDFIQQCLQVNPKDRPTAAELLEHPFVNK
ncbi:hypothetical protein P3X46_013418 [Hevea brasiliensis]|uniref:mitogen-activated protein kinase kinase kinase n=1 Tax=Hevea brasiliensis TaxID=3981 RepID=A0ABQ9M4K9_HEVBR|nr:hypothetical protein P3X46_013418 [Hevea brasiliensis]